MPSLLKYRKKADSCRIVFARKTAIPNIIYFDSVNLYENKLFGDRVCFRINGINGYPAFCDYREEVIAATIPHVQMGGEFVDAAYDKEFAEAFQKEAEIKLIAWRNSWNPQKFFWICEIRNPLKRLIAVNSISEKPPAEQLAIFKRLTEERLETAKTAP